MKRNDKNAAKMVVTFRVFHHAVLTHVDIKSRPRDRDRPAPPPPRFSLVLLTRINRTMSCGVRVAQADRSSHLTAHPV